MGAGDKVTRRDLKDPVALQTTVDQLRERVNSTPTAAETKQLVKDGQSPNTGTIIVGPWWVLNIAASGSADMEFVSSVAVVEYVAQRAGKLVGISASRTAVHTAGVLRIQTTVTEDGTATVVDDHVLPEGDMDYVPEPGDFPSYDFKRGARLKVSYDADGSLSPNGSIDMTAWLEVSM